MSWNNVKQLPCSQCLCCCLHLFGFPPLKWSHGSGNSSLAPAHRCSHPKTTLVQTEWQTRDDTVSSASYARRVCWFDAGGNGGDAAEFCWRGAFSISTEARRSEKCPLVNNTLSVSCHILKNNILKGWTLRGSVLVPCRHHTCVVLPRLLQPVM